MEEMQKIYSKKYDNVVLHAIKGHFATNHSHINYYIDVTSLKTRVNEAKRVAECIAEAYDKSTVIDTIVCMDGTEVIGAYLAELFAEKGFVNTNKHDTIYVVIPEFNAYNQMIFRENLQPAIRNKNVLLLLATTTTGRTVQKSVEGIEYYEGTVSGISSLFSTVDKVEGLTINRVLTEKDLPGYQTFSRAECPYCRKGMQLEAMVNGFGYSRF